MDSASVEIEYVQKAEAEIPRISVVDTVAGPIVEITNPFRFTKPQQ